MSFESRPERTVRRADSGDAGAYALKHLQWTLTAMAAERGDDVWQVGNRVKLVAALGAAASEQAEAKVLLGRTRLLLRQVRQAVGEARAQVDRLSLHNGRGKAPPQDVALDKVLVAWPANDLARLAQDYVPVCGRLAPRQFRKLSATLQQQRSGAGRVLAMPECGKLQGAFAGGGASTYEQRRLKGMAAAALDRLASRVDEACREMGLG